MLSSRRGMGKHAIVSASTAAVCGLIATVALLGSQSQPEQRPPSFRSETQIIEVDAVVTDRDSNFVFGLSKEDFEIFEDGKLRDVFRWSLVNVPVRGRTDASPRPPDSAPTLDAMLDGRLNGRMYVMVIDTPSIAFGREDRMKRIARRFVEDVMGPDDLMAIVHVPKPISQQPARSQEMARVAGAYRSFTGNREELLASIEKVKGPECPPDPSGAFGCPSWPARSTLLDTWRVLQEVSRNLGGVTGRRKAILFFGSGPFPEGGVVAQTAIRSNVAIHVIDPSGLRPAVEANIAGETSPFIDDPQARLASKIDRFDPIGERQFTLRMLASATGGLSLVNTNNWIANYPRIVRQDSTYYMLAYQTAPLRDGKFHAIRVRVKGRPDLTVRARQGYQAPASDVRGRVAPLPAGLSSAVRNALTGKTLFSELSLKTFAVPFRRSGGGAVLVIETHIDRRGLSQAARRLELLLTATDVRGKVRETGRQAIDVPPQALGVEPELPNTVRVFSRLNVPRGRFTVRVVVQQPSGPPGSAQTVVDVPDFTEGSVSVSDMVIAANGGENLLTLVEDSQFMVMLDGQVTHRQEFSTDETVSMFAEVYDNHPMLSKQVGITSTVTSASGDVISRVERTFEADDDQTRFSFNAKLSLSGVPPGAYALTLEAHSTGVPGATTSRQVQFSVVAGNRRVVTQAGAQVLLAARPLLEVASRKRLPAVPPSPPLPPLAAPTPVVIGTSDVSAARTRPSPLDGQAAQVFRGETDLVSVAVTVTDGDARFVSGLTKEDFVVSDKGRRQEVVAFTSDRVPVSLGVVLDASGSMSNTRLATARQALDRLIERLAVDDELFFAEFADETRVLQGWTQDRFAFQRATRAVRGGNFTGLYDAVNDLLPLASAGKHSKKALLIISDGDNNYSSVTLERVQEAIRQSDVLIYALGIEETELGYRPINRGALRKLTDDSGGRTDIVNGVGKLSEAIARLVYELGQQYVIGYARPEGQRGWHDIKVEMPGRRGITIRARRGYVAN
jgi:Ca-activated chloride channel homolog